MTAYTYWNIWGTPFLDSKNENHNTEKLREECLQWGGDSRVINNSFLTDRTNMGSVPGEIIKSGIYESTFNFLKEAEERECSEIIILNRWLEVAIGDMFWDYFIESGHYRNVDYEFDNLDMKREDVYVDIRESWLHITGNGGSHGAHDHLGFSWAFIYYVDIGDSTSKNGQNVFYSYGRGGRDVNQEFGDFYKSYDLHTVVPENGKLSLFPADVVHSAHVYLTKNKPRVVIAGNVKIHSDKWYERKR